MPGPEQGQGTGEGIERFLERLKLDPNITNLSPDGLDSNHELPRFPDPVRIAPHFQYHILSAAEISETLALFAPLKPQERLAILTEAIRCHGSNPIRIDDTTLRIRQQDGNFKLEVTTLPKVQLPGDLIFKEIAVPTEREYNYDSFGEKIPSTQPAERDLPTFDFSDYELRRLDKLLKSGGATL